MVAFADKLHDIARACESNDVKRLELFGSRARADATVDSDADFLVEFHNPLRPGLLDRFIALRSGLEQILGCSVDLIEVSAVENPIFRKRIDESRTTVYAA
jgi:predicted nucleotidyltransferase